MDNSEPQPFICPECGSTEASIVAMLSIRLDIKNPSKDPWNGVLQTISCAQCHFVIPAHIAERWDNMSVEEAQQEWKTDYRSTAWQEDDE